MTEPQAYTCPNCQQTIYDDDALLCHFCGESLQRAGAGFLSQLRYTNQKGIWLLLILVALCAFVMLYVL